MELYIGNILWSNFAEVYFHTLFGATLWSCISTHSLEQLYGVVFLHFLWSSFGELYIHNILWCYFVEFYFHTFFRTTLQCCIFTLHLEQLCGDIYPQHSLEKLCEVVFPHFLWRNFAEFYIHTSFGAALRGYITTLSLEKLCGATFPQHSLEELCKAVFPHFLWSNFAELYFHTSFGAVSRSCCEVVASSPQ